MCGINGIVDQADAPGLIPWRTATAKAMNTALQHRGPDGDGVWHDNHAALGHRRLAVIDLSPNAAQPMTCPDSRYILTYNGEVYNFKDLRSRCSSSAPWRSSGDSELVLRLISQHWEQAFELLEGMFALACWDRKERRLILARDHFGIKPLYYTFDQSQGRLIFSSEIKGLFAAGVVPRANSEKVAQFLLGGALDYDDQTWYEGVYSVPAGSYLLFQDGRITVRRYYDLTKKVDEASPLKGDELHSAFAARLQEVVRRTLVSDRPVGIHLSGGVDSSLLALVAAQFSQQPLSSYTFGFRELEFDEGRYGREVATKLGLPHQVSYLTPQEVPHLTEQTLREQCEPFTSLRQISHHKLYADFKSSGPTVVLEGAGGDEIGAGYRSHILGAFLDTSVREGGADAIRWLCNSAPFSKISPEHHPSLLASLILSYTHPGIAASDGTVCTEPHFVNASLREQIGKTHLEYERPFRSHLRNQQLIDIVSAKLPRGLRYIERASMASSREARLPLLDTRLVEMGIAATTEEKVTRDGVGRAFFQRLLPRLSGNLSSAPPSLLGMKRSVADPQRAWIKGQLHEYIQDVISSKRCRERGILNPDSILEYLKNFNPGSPTHNSLTVFQPFITELWFQTLIDTTNPVDSAS